MQLLTGSTVQYNSVTGIVTCMIPAASRYPSHPSCSDTLRLWLDTPADHAHDAVIASMVSSHLPLPPAGTPSSSASSDPRYTPVGGSDEDASQPSPRRPPVGSLKLKTDFGRSRDVETAASRASDDDSAYDSGDKLQETPSQPGHSPRYSMAEETQVIRAFDRKLVPFLALLYLLSFLDRSSMLLQPFSES